MSRIGLLETVWQDVKYSLRMMSRNPAFSVAIILTVAVGIGANAAMFSVIRAVLLKPLGYEDPDRLVLIADGVTPVHFDELKASSHSYVEIAAYAGGVEDIALSGIGQPEVLKGARRIEQLSSASRCKSAARTQLLFRRRQARRACRGDAQR